jgi:hypothetical protein
LAIFLAHEIPFWSYVVFELALLQRFKVFETRKLRGGVPPSQELYNRAVQQIALGHVTTQLVFLFFAFDLFRGRGVLVALDDWPSPLDFLWQFPLFMILCDTLLYW